MLDYRAKLIRLILFSKLPSHSVGVFLNKLSYMIKNYVLKKKKKQPKTTLLVSIVLFIGLVYAPGILLSNLSRGDLP